MLVVDDDAALRVLLKSILSSADYDVAMAPNGRDALDVAGNRHIDVIVLDVQMPVLDGPSFFRQLRARGDTTPVLLASAYGARAAQKELGAEGSIEKPFEPDDLLAAIGKLVPPEEASPALQPRRRGRRNA